MAITRIGIGKFSIAWFNPYPTARGETASKLRFAI